MENDLVLGITQASKRVNRLRQTLYLAIRKGRLKAFRDSTGRWKIPLSELENYWKTRYSRDSSRINGELVYDINKGTYSVNLAARRLNIPPQKLYFAARQGYITFVRKGSAYVFKEKDLEKYAAKHLKSPIQKSAI